MTVISLDLLWLPLCRITIPQHDCEISWSPVVPIVWNDFNYFTFHLCVSSYSEWVLQTVSHDSVWVCKTEHGGYEKLGNRQRLIECSVTKNHFKSKQTYNESELFPVTHLCDITQLHAASVLNTLHCVCPHTTHAWVYGLKHVGLETTVCYQLLWFYCLYKVFCLYGNNSLFM